VVFRNLPIEIDVYGRAALRDQEAVAPFRLEEDGRVLRLQNRDRALEKLAAGDRLWNFSIDPLTRAQSGLALLTVIDFDQRRILDARIEAAEYNVTASILKGREPSDAILIGSRRSGASSVANSIAAAMALEMACGVSPPPLAVLIRNIGSCGEMICENIQHLFLHAGPDYSEAAVSRTSLQLWAKAQKTPTRHYSAHGLETIADLMRGMNTMTGHLYLDAIQMSRLAAEICTILLGKFPHPTTITPAGVSIDPSREIFNQALGRINTLLDYAKKAVAVWDDLADFFYDADPRYRRVGELPGNLLSVGVWDDENQYDASYQNSKDWGDARMSLPGVIIGNEVRTRRLTDINIGIEEFAEHSYLDLIGRSGKLAVDVDPLDEPLSPRHPWNVEMVPMPVERNWKERYSWRPAPRWDRESMETGPLARLWINTLLENQNCEFIRASRRQELEIRVPKGQQPATNLIWRIPERPNTLERNRARAYNIAYAGMIAYGTILKAFECIRRGEKATSVRFRLPEQKLGVGFWECGRGSLMHYLSIKHHQILNYRMMTPAEWMGSPRDAIGLPGVYESALMNTPLLEQCTRAEDFTGIDILRTIRSFDP
jgi:hydrogenase large subunit